MAVKIRLKRMGKIRAPFYRVVIADSRTKRDGRAIEEIGRYHPTAEPSLIDIDSERAQYWLGVGAQPSEQVKVLLKVTGDWQRFTGEPGAEGTLKVAEPRVDKKIRYEAALAAADGAESATSQRRGRPSTPVQETPVADAPVEQAPAGAETPVEEAPAIAEVPVEEAPATADESAAAPEGAEQPES